MYQSLFSPLLFRLDPETAHHLMLRSCRLADTAVIRGIIRRHFALEESCLSCERFGLRFANPIGLAAGFDKNAEIVRVLAALGFGFLELGSITGQAQPGNPRPRIFRYPQQRALINRMGFPSEGADVVAARLAVLRGQAGLPPIGINLGKTKSVPLDEALSDYLYTFERVQQYADYVALNVSSPNTPELRKLQERPRLEALFRGVQEHNRRKVPLLIKIAPDLELRDLDDVLDCCLACNVAGIIATNTTFSREGLPSGVTETGGLSGEPLRQKSLEMVAYIYSRTQGALPIVGVGGVSTAQHAFDLIAAGASLIQLYTALVYEGPSLVRRIKSELAVLLRERGLNSLDQLVGQQALAVATKRSEQRRVNP